MEDTIFAFMEDPYHEPNIVHGGSTVDGGFMEDTIYGCFHQIHSPSTVLYLLSSSMNKYSTPSSTVDGGFMEDEPSINRICFHIAPYS